MRQFYLDTIIGTNTFFQASFNRYTEIVKILAALTDNPNASDHYGTTPIQVAANYGHTEIVKMLDQFDRKC